MLLLKNITNDMCANERGAFKAFKKHGPICYNICIWIGYVCFHDLCLSTKKALMFMLC